MLRPRLSTADLVVDDKVVKRTGNTLTATGHIITAVVGAGILNLPSAFSYFGWIAGVLVMLLIGGITWWTSLMLVQAYQWDGKTHRTYYAAVKHLCGPKHAYALVIMQHANLVLTALSYAITVGTALRKIALELAPADTDPNSIIFQIWFWTFVFSAIQLILSQVCQQGNAYCGCVL